MMGGIASSVVWRYFICLEGRESIDASQGICICYHTYEATQILNHTIKGSLFILHFLRKFLHNKAQVCWHTLISLLLILPCLIRKKGRRYNKHKGRNEKKILCKPQIPEFIIIIIIIITHFSTALNNLYDTNTICWTSPNNLETWEFAKGLHCKKKQCVSAELEKAKRFGNSHQFSGKHTKDVTWRTGPRLWSTKLHPECGP